MARRPVRRRRRTDARWPLLIVIALILLIAALFGARWLAAHPQHNPWAALSLNDPTGWATQRKLTALVDDPPACRRLLTEAGARFGTLPSVGSGACALQDRTALTGQAITPLQVPLRPREAASTCAVAAGLTLWLRDGVQPAAERHLGRRVVALEHLGTVNCRRIGGSDAWSEHATGNAIDIAAFVLSDGSRVSVLDHWDARDGRSAFLRGARDAACQVYSTTLSPDYNRAHADHFHLDMGARMGSVCR
jgi:hypothetical protein